MDTFYSEFHNNVLVAKRTNRVFDAFIVVSSFALDFVFLDSRWYETGKDATTILVLLLPWRVVRIVNSFLMTMKHKHHIQMMNMKRARKKAELKAAKLQTLLSEVRKDVQLLVALCRSNEIEEKDITACLYGKGRRSVTLSAMSTCTSLMLISTLGKDAVQEDDIYGKVFKEALNEGDNAEMNSEIQQAEEAAIDAAIELDEKIKARRKSKKYNKKTRVKRSYTVPRRTASVDIPEPDINENDSNIFYINDSYLRAAAQATSPSGSGDFPPVPGGLTNCNMVSEEDEHHCNHTGHTTAVAQTSARSKYQSTASLRSLPVRKGSRSNSMV
ncbi:voltage-gated hydrogen channel 1, partial [Biomphalaria glabrata]